MEKKRFAAMAAALMICVPAATSYADDVVTRTTPADNGWASEDHYWSSNYNARPYYSNTRPYSNYAPAYRYGVESYKRYNGADYNSLNKAELEKGWNAAKGNSDLTWEEAELASQDAYKRMYDNNDRNGNGINNTTVPQTSMTGVH